MTRTIFLDSLCFSRRCWSFDQQLFLQTFLVGQKTNKGGKDQQGRKLYPNPTNGRYLNIVYQFAQNAKVRAELYDITGRLIDVKEMPFNDNTQECHFTFDIAKMQLPSGSYILKLKSNKEIHTEKFVHNK